jgi:hypothetical protein
MIVALLALVLVLVPLAAAAEVRLPAGFTAQVYVTGEGFDTDTSRGVRGIPATSTLAVDQSGLLYLARTGRRYVGGEFYDLWPIYRIPAGGARLTPDAEGRYLYGPPLPNPQVGATRRGRELFVTTFDRERRVGALYRVVDGRAELFAGGTPERGARPVLRQPEAAVVDSAGNIYVADRAQGVVVRLNPEGRVLEPSYVTIARPRLLAIDEQDHLWIGSDGSAEAPYQRGPVIAALGLGPGNVLFVADRHEKQIFILTPDGKRIDFASFTNGDVPRGLGFAPVTPETRRAGVAGDLFVVTIKGGTWPVNEVIRISGPFDDLARPR